MYIHLHLMLILSQQWCEEYSLLIARLLERGKLQVVCIFKKAQTKRYVCAGIQGTHHTSVSQQRGLEYHF